eukprot:Hpha_TRINITY_DN34140_c0_g1::TRINITY_DN34140_c0_g1_i1::g.75879::m.75879
MRACTSLAVLTVAGISGAVLTPDCQLGVGLTLESVGTPTVATDGRVQTYLRALCAGSPTRLQSAVAVNGRCGDAGYQLYDGGQPVSADEAQWCLAPASVASTSGSTTTTGGSTAVGNDVLVLVLLDTSNSVASSPSVLADLKAAVTSFTDAVLAAAPTAEITIQAFDGRSGTQSVVDFTSNANSISSAMQGFTCDASGPFCRDPDSTNLYGALYQSVRLIELASQTRSVAQSVLVFFTDGTDQSQRLTQADAVTQLRSLPNLEVYAVGVEGETRAGATGADVAELTVLALGDPTHVLTTTQIGALSTPFVAVAQRVATSVSTAAAVGGGLYLLEYCTPRRTDSNPLRLRYQGLDLGWQTVYQATGIDTELARSCGTSACVCTPAPPAPPPSPPPPI